jgi:hypothetical protein
VDPKFFGWSESRKTVGLCFFSKVARKFEATFRSRSIVWDRSQIFSWSNLRVEDLGLLGESILIYKQENGTIIRADVPGRDGGGG